jgi:hypothetical protein
MDGDATTTVVRATLAELDRLGLASEPPSATASSPNAPRQLVIVAARETRLYEHLRTTLARDTKTVVVLDRRCGRSSSVVVERRKPVTHRLDLGLHPVIVAREEAPMTFGGTAPAPARAETANPWRGGGTMNNGEVIVVDDRQRIERWAEDSQYVIGRMIPSLLEERDRWRGKAEAADQEIDRLRLELGALRKDVAELRAEREFVRTEQAAISDAFTKAMEHLAQLQQPLGDVLHRLQSMQPVLAETNAR